jgi:hypothetical protein
MGDAAGDRAATEEMDAAAESVAEEVDTEAAAAAIADDAGAAGYDPAFEPTES